MAHAGAAEPGVGKQVLGRWVPLAGEAAEAGDTGAVLDANERAELAHLRGESGGAVQPGHSCKTGPGASPCCLRAIG